MKITSGIYLITPSGKMVIAHPTNTPFCMWSIPKGLVDEGETLFDAAKREFFEETNYLIDESKLLLIESLGEPLKYNKKDKYLNAYVCLLNEEIEQELVCTSMVEDAVPFPENDYIEVIDINKAFDKLFPLQKEYKNAVLKIYNDFYEHKDKN